MGEDEKDKWEREGEKEGGISLPRLSVAEPMHLTLPDFRKGNKELRCISVKQATVGSHLVLRPGPLIGDFQPQFNCLAQASHYFIKKRKKKSTCLEWLLGK